MKSLNIALQGVVSQLFSMNFKKPHCANFKTHIVQISTLLGLVLIDVVTLTLFPKLRKSLFQTKPHC